MTNPGQVREVSASGKQADLNSGGSRIRRAHRTAVKPAVPKARPNFLVSAPPSGHSDLATMKSEESLWPDIRKWPVYHERTFFANLRRYLKKAGLPLAGVHIFRHSAAELRRDAGESIEDLSRFLDHSSLAVTTTYLRRLEGQEDRAWAQVAAAIGV